MAVTVAPSASLCNLNFSLNLIAAVTGDDRGSSVFPSISDAVNYDPTGVLPPGITAWAYGVVTVGTAGDLLVAAATIVQSPLTGAISYMRGITSGATRKLITLYLKNLHATIAMNVQRKTTNGLPIFLAGDDGETIPPLGSIIRHAPGGLIAGAALTSGSNDGLTVTPASGSPTLLFAAVYN